MSNYNEKYIYIRTVEDAKRYAPKLATDEYRDLRYDTGFSVLGGAGSGVFWVEDQNEYRRLNPDYVGDGYRALKADEVWQEGDQQKCFHEAAWQDKIYDLGVERVGERWAEGRARRPLAKPDLTQLEVLKSRAAQLASKVFSLENELAQKNLTLVAQRGTIDYLQCVINGLTNKAPVAVPREYKLEKPILAFNFIGGDTSVVSGGPLDEIFRQGVRAAGGTTL